MTTRGYVKPLNDNRSEFEKSPEYEKFHKAHEKLEALMRKRREALMNKLHPYNSALHKARLALESLKTVKFGSPIQSDDNGEFAESQTEVVNFTGYDGDYLLEELEEHGSVLSDEGSNVGDFFRNVKMQEASVKHLMYKVLDPVKLDNFLHKSYRAAEKEAKQAFKERTAKAKVGKLRAKKAAPVADTSEEESRDPRQGDDSDEPAVSPVPQQESNG